MREDKEKSQRETGAAIAFVGFLLNLLIFLVLCGSILMLQSLITRNGSSPGTFLNEIGWR